MKKATRILSLLLAVCIVISQITVASFAAIDLAGATIFEFGANGTASHNDGSKASADLSYTEGDYTLTLTGLNNVYSGARDAKGNSVIKLGSSKAVGGFTFAVPDDVTTVVINAAQYKANKTIYDVNGIQYTVETASNNGEYTQIEVDTTTVKSVSVTTVSGGVRGMIDSIAFVAPNGSADCTHEYNNDCDGDCNLCGALRTPIHTYSESARVEAQCETAGSVTYTCPVCQDSYEEPIEALGHDFAAGEVISNTATEEGYTIYNCSRCEATETRDITNPTGTDSYIIFYSGDNGAAKHNDGKEIADGATYTNGNYTLKIDAPVKVYEKATDATGRTAFKLGTGSVAASFSFTVPADVTKAVISAAMYKDDATTILINDQENVLETLSDNGAYTAIEVDTSENKTVTVATTTDTPRAMIRSIAYVVCAHEFGEGTVTEATETTCGYTSYTCALCGMVNKENYTAPLSGKVQNVSANAVDGTVSIAWDALDGADKYIASVFAADGTKVRNAQTAASAITFFGLEDGEYTVKVIARVAGKWFAYDNADAVALAIEGPAGPAATLASATYNSLTASWTATEGAIKYFVKVNGGNIARVYTTTESTITLNNLDANTEYSFSVCTKLADGTYTEYSDAAVLSTTDYAEVPVAIEAQAGGNITLSWDAEKVITAWIKVVNDDGSKTQIGVAKGTGSYTFAPKTDDAKYCIIAKVNIDGVNKYITSDTVELMGLEEINGEAAASLSGKLSLGAINSTLSLDTPDLTIGDSNLEQSGVNELVFNGGVIETPYKNGLRITNFGASHVYNEFNGSRILLKVPANTKVVFNNLTINGYYNFIDPARNKNLTLEFVNCTFNGNWVGETNGLTNITFTNCEFTLEGIDTANIKDTNPLWLMTLNNQTLTLDGCTIQGNRPIKYGEGASGASLSVTNCEFNLSMSAWDENAYAAATTDAAREKVLSRLTAVRFDANVTNAEVSGNTVVSGYALYQTDNAPYSNADYDDSANNNTLAEGTLVRVAY